MSQQVRYAGANPTVACRTLRRPGNAVPHRAKDSHREAPKGAYRVRVQVTDSARTRFAVRGDSEFE